VRVSVEGRRARKARRNEKQLRSKSQEIPAANESSELIAMLQFAQPDNGRYRQIECIRGGEWMVGLRCRPRLSVRRESGSAERMSRARCSPSFRHLRRDGNRPPRFMRPLQIAIRFLVGFASTCGSTASPPEWNSGAITPANECCVRDPRRRSSGTSSCSPCSRRRKRTFWVALRSPRAYSQRLAEFSRVRLPPYRRRVRSPRTS